MNTFIIWLNKLKIGLYCRRSKAKYKVVVFLSICYAANTALHVCFSTVVMSAQSSKNKFWISKTYIFLYFLPVDGSTRLPPGLFFIEAWNPSPLHPGLYSVHNDWSKMIWASFLRKLRSHVQKCMQIDFMQLMWRTLCTILCAFASTLEIVCFLKSVWRSDVPIF